MTSATIAIPDSPAEARLPLSGLLALAMAAFITLLTEILPSGLLPQMAASLGKSEALIGQLVTVYAIGSLLTAIPLTILTQSWRRAMPHGWCPSIFRAAPSLLPWSARRWPCRWGSRPAPSWAR